MAPNYCMWVYTVTEINDIHYKITSSYFFPKVVYKKYIISTSQTSIQLSESSLLALVSLSRSDSLSAAGTHSCIPVESSFLYFFLFADYDTCFSNCQLTKSVLITSRKVTLCSEMIFYLLLHVYSL